MAKEKRKGGRFCLCTNCSQKQLPWTLKTEHNVENTVRKGTDGISESDSANKRQN